MVSQRVYRKGSFRVKARRPFNQRQSQVGIYGKPQYKSHIREFPMRGPNSTHGAYYEDTHKKDPQFIETTMLWAVVNIT